MEPGASRPKRDSDLPDDEDAAKPEIGTPEVIAALRSAGFDPGNPAAASKALEFSLMMFGGPLPPPGLLDQYNKVMPGLSDRLVGWVEQQRDFRQSRERFRDERSQARMDRGQIIAAAVAIIGLILTAGVGVFGNPFVAATMAIVSIGGPTAAGFLARRGVTPKSGAVPANPREDASVPTRPAPPRGPG